MKIGLTRIEHFRATQARLCSHVQWVLQKDPPLKELLTFEHHKKSAVGVLSALFFVSCGTARPPKWFELNHENALSDRNCIN